MSEFVVHFTKADEDGNDPGKPYRDHLSILWDGRLQPGEKPFGAARRDRRLGSSQRAVCFSEIPLALVRRLAERRGSRYGIGFTKAFVRRQGAARVWYLDKDEHTAKAFQQLMEAHVARFDARDPFWQLTPLVDRPGSYPGRDFRFEWEREWRLPGISGLRFAMGDIAFLFIPEEWHAAARSFFDSYEPGTAPKPTCPFLDVTWDPVEIATALATGGSFRTFDPGLLAAGPSPGASRGRPTGRG
jgi:hypothetical protein